MSNSVELTCRMRGSDTATTDRFRAKALKMGAESVNTRPVENNMYELTIRFKRKKDKIAFESTVKDVNKI